MTTIIAEQPTGTVDHKDLRDRLARVTSATASLTPSAHRLLVNSLNVLGEIGDQVDSIDAGDWTHVHMRAMCALENMEANRLVGQPYEAWGTQLKHELAILAGLISRVLAEDEPQSTDPDHHAGACDYCTCCSAAGCENGQCPTDRIGDSVCPCTSVDRMAGQPTHLAAQIVAMLAELAADRALEPGGHHFNTALRGALRFTCPNLALTQLHDEADRLIEQARRDQMAAEYGETPAAVSRG